MRTVRIRFQFFSADESDLRVTISIQESYIHYTLDHHSETKFKLLHARHSETGMHHTGLNH